MSVTYLTVKGNTAPGLEITLQRKNGSPIPLTDATSVILRLKSMRTKTIVNTGHQTCGIVDAENGIINYPVQVGDYADSNYKAEVKITYTDGGVRTIYDQLIIEPRNIL